MSRNIHQESQNKSQVMTEGLQRHYESFIYLFQDQRGWKLRVVNKNGHNSHRLLYTLSIWGTRAFSTFKYDTSREKPMRQVWPLSIVCLLKMWWLHTTAAHNGKWHSRVQMISWNECIFQKPLFGCGDARTTNVPHNKRRHLEEGGEKKKKFLSLSWHDKSVCISTPFITSRPRQWIEFQKPINKGDVHSAWQLSRASVPLSFTHPPSLPRLPPSLFSFPFFWND